MSVAYQDECFASERGLTRQAGRHMFVPWFGGGPLGILPQTMLRPQCIDLVAFYREVHVGDAAVDGGGSRRAGG